MHIGQGIPLIKKNPCTMFMYISCMCSYIYMYIYICFFFHGPFLIDVLGLSVSSYCGTAFFVIYNWSLDTPCQRSALGKSSVRWTSNIDNYLMLQTANQLCFSSFLLCLLLHVIIKLFIQQFHSQLNSFLFKIWSLCYLCIFITKPHKG